MTLKKPNFIYIFEEKIISEKETIAALLSLFQILYEIKTENSLKNVQKNLEIKL